MGALGTDLAVTAKGDGVYGATIREDWEMWGPLGGYVAALALQAIGRENLFARPVSFSCEFAERASFGPAQVVVRSLRTGPTAALYAAVVQQGDRTVLEATCWSSPRAEGPEHLDLAWPIVEQPEDAYPSGDRLAWLPFTKNLAVRFLAEGPGAGAKPRWRGWTAFTPVATFLDDAWLDAARSVILLDVSGFSAAAMYHGVDAPFTAPSLDLHVSFHHNVQDAEWLLMDSHSPLSINGVLTWQGALWTADGRLAALGSGQNLWREA